MPTLLCLQERKALNLCPVCGDPKNPERYRCDICGVKHRQWQRGKGGYNPQPTTHNPQPTTHNPQQLSGRGKPIIYPGEEV